MKIYFRVATAAGIGRRCVLGPETLQGSPGLDPGAIPGEMLVRQQSSCRGLIVMRLKKAAAKSDRRKRSRFLEKTEWSQTMSSMDRPTNQRNRRLSSNCSIFRIGRRG